MKNKTTYSNIYFFKLIQMDIDQVVDDQVAVLNENA